MKTIKTLVGLGIILSSINSGFCQTPPAAGKAPAPAANPGKVPDRISAPAQPALLKNSKVKVDDSKLAPLRAQNQGAGPARDGVQPGGIGAPAVKEGSQSETIVIDERLPAVSPEQLKAERAAWRKQFDKNGDGKLDPAEQEAIRASLRAKMKQGTPVQAPAPAGGNK